MKIEINKEWNTIRLSFIDNETRDDNLLITLSEVFTELDQYKDITIDCIGKIYIEVAVYIVQVSEFSTIIVKLSNEDTEAKSFIDLTAITSGNKNITTIIKED